MTTTTRSTGSVAKLAGQAKDAAELRFGSRGSRASAASRPSRQLSPASDTASRSAGFGPIEPLVRDLAGGPPLKTAARRGGSAIMSDAGHEPDINFCLV